MLSPVLEPGPVLERAGWVQEKAQWVLASRSCIHSGLRCGGGKQRRVRRTEANLL